MMNLALENVPVANLNTEQLAALKDLEKKLGVTLVAYEQTS